MNHIRNILLALLFIGSSAVFAYHPITKNKMPSHAGVFSNPYPAYPTIKYGPGMKGDIVRRGEYLVKMGDCIACHTKPGHEPFSGSFELKTPFGSLISPNITPDTSTGLGEWSYQDFEKAMRHGQNPKGGTYYPAFPYSYFTKISDQDMQAIWSYLKAIPAVSNKNEPHKLHFPFNLPVGKTVWRTLYLNDSGPYEYDNTESATWNRGAYLVEGLGHCSMCHSPKNLLGADLKSRHLSGSFMDGFWAPDINSVGLADVSVDDVVKVFTQSRLPNQEAGTVAGPMAAVNHDSLAYVDKEDLTAMATYLKNVDADEYDVNLHTDRSAFLSKGRKVYQRACAMCHQTGQLGAPVISDSENWQLRIKKGIPAFYRNVMYGYNNMPIKGNCTDCTDSDIKAAVHYVVHKAIGDKKMKEISSGNKKREVSMGDGKHLYQQVCAQCHEKGILNAPKVGDKKVWAPLIKKDIDVLVKTAVRGNHKKPYMSGCKSCSVQDIKAAVKYMVQESKTKGDYSLW